MVVSCYNITIHRFPNYAKSLLQQSTRVLPVVKDKGFGEGLYFESTDVCDDRWYNWRVANWGTKWDCYDLSIDQDEQELNLEFNTAWSPPEEICYALKRKFEDADIQWFYDEPGMEFAGYL